MIKTSLKKIVFDLAPKLVMLLTLIYCYQFKSHSGAFPSTRTHLRFALAYAKSSVGAEITGVNGLPGKYTETKYGMGLASKLTKSGVYLDRWLPLEGFWLMMIYELSKGTLEIELKGN